MKSILFAGLVAALPLAGAGPVKAEIQSRTVYSYKAWTVQRVRFSDDSYACQARVSNSGYSLSIWAYPSHKIKLQFYSQSWGFGNTRGNLKIRVDQHNSWRLSNAHLYKHSVLFTLPGTASGKKFITQVAEGSYLVLMNDSGKRVHGYSLSGSRASIENLISCVRALPGSSSNPFK